MTKEFVIVQENEDEEEEDFSQEQLLELDELLKDQDQTNAEEVSDDSPKRYVKS